MRGNPDIIGVKRKQLSQTSISQFFAKKKQPPISTASSSSPSRLSDATTLSLSAEDNDDKNVSDDTQREQPLYHESVEVILDLDKFCAPATSNTECVKQHCVDTKSTRCHEIYSAKSVDKKQQIRKRETNQDINSLQKSMKLTPLQHQVNVIRSKYPDLLLMVEVGYKYRFFGDDAIVASHLLDIGCFDNHNMCSASVPVQRLSVHLTRLVENGHKVGIVTQTESAVLKENSKALERDLNAIYTKATLYCSTLRPHSSSLAITPRRIVVVIELPSNNLSCNTRIAFASADPLSEEVIFDEWNDTPSRQGLATRLAHLEPVELLIPKLLSSATKKLLSTFPSSGLHCVRREYVSDTSFDMTRINTILSSSHHNDKLNTLSFSDLSIRCLAHLEQYLSIFTYLTVFTSSLFTHAQPFTSLSTFRISASALVQLNILPEPNTGEKYSLFTLIDHTMSAFGSRLLRQWTLSPSTCSNRILERLDAVEELKNVQFELASTMRLILKKLVDVDSALASISSQKCTPKTFYNTMSSFREVGVTLDSLCGVVSTCNSLYLQRLFHSLSSLNTTTRPFLEPLNEKAALSDNVLTVFSQVTDPESLLHIEAIARAEKELQNILLDIRKQQRNPNLVYKSVLTNEYLIELTLAKARNAPSSWLRMGSTSKYERFRPPRVADTLTLLQESRERHLMAAQRVWKCFIRDFQAHYKKFRKFAQCLAELDCLLALASVAKNAGYVRPNFLLNQSEQKLHILNGRHPVVESFGTSSFVPNDCMLNSSGEYSQLIFGPNAGGKSTLVRQVAIIVIMAQIGSFVPAQSCHLTIFDGIFVRMGACDQILRGQSTFMMELSETSHILRTATSRSLVLLDELGRGTSTHDGVAVAYATLKYLLESIHCFCLFVTHYPALRSLCSNAISSYYMDHIETSNTNEITFLFKLVKGDCTLSYGLNAARLARLPDQIVHRAAFKSHELQNKIELINALKKMMLSKDVNAVRALQRVV